MANAAQLQDAHTQLSVGEQHGHCGDGGVPVGEDEEQHKEPAGLRL
eukprot:CAMPEP_0198683292 /NCGR_PEP_ID=MMETSP1468-20131203/10348_1 /TAXON_ID=1461545 /ORGANISM="Mantoniella sp, Strain CCMP1436" /LENGTH=45 /DNA_ID= /DNA_START= /DNA_END= /DNA_ORIENTATION=